MIVDKLDRREKIVYDITDRARIGLEISSLYLHYVERTTYETFQFTAIQCDAKKG